MKTTLSIEPEIEVWYMKAFATFHILTGVLFSVIFILGALILKDFFYFLYLILSIGIVVMGINRLRKPYICCFKNEITVTGLFGEISKTYKWEQKNEICISGNRVFVQGKKLKFNSWFTNVHQYQKMLRYLSGENMPADELQHD
ncbi:MAG: hypothetical protein IPM74_17935 [Crocinitomicaceae bacterium]|nr:hypothetical protein [Crocinitomicaceae bacterium]